MRLPSAVARARAIVPVPRVNASVRTVSMKVKLLPVLRLVSRLAIAPGKKGVLVLPVLALARLADNKKAIKGGI